MTATRFLLPLLLALVIPAGSQAQVLEPLAVDPGHPTYDPWEPVNRSIFVFNENLDHYFLRPVAQGYHNVTPDPVERSVGNFISNLGELNNVFNAALQGRTADVIHSSGRFLVNTTIGLAGLFDIASGMGVERRYADFGQTLSVWGLNAGPYVMLPGLGPRTVRSAAGTTVDSFASPQFIVDEELFTYPFLVMDTIDTRARLLDAEQLISGDRYIFTRAAYYQRREYFLSGGKVNDTFSDFEEEDFEDF